MTSPVVVATDSAHLRSLITDAIKRHGNRCSLNHIDVTNIHSLDRMFSNSRFTGSISQWNTKNVQSMRYTFAGSHFNGNLTAWNVSRVHDMEGMFEESRFTKSIDNWNVARVKNFKQMFHLSRFRKNLSAWCIAENANTESMVQHDFSGLLPRDLMATQWLSLRSHGPWRNQYFERCPTFIPGMTWWLYLAQTPRIPAAVPSPLHPWLKIARALGQELGMPLADMAVHLSLLYPMKEENRSQLNALVRREYSVRCAILEIIKPPPGLADDTWDSGSTALARRRFHAILGAQQELLVPPETYPLPRM